MGLDESIAEYINGEGRLTSLDDILDIAFGPTPSIAFMRKVPDPLTRAYESRSEGQRSTEHAIQDSFSPENYTYEEAADAEKSDSPPPWMLAITPTFRKEIEGMDRKLLGRIMTALSELSGSVIAIRGDTLKPLVGQYKNCWRIRVGDYRLIFCPDRSLSRLTLLSFGARGGVYDD